MPLLIDIAVSDAIAQSEELRRQTIESDRRYFEMGAKKARLPGAQVTWVPGLAHCPSALVVQDVSPAVVAREGDAWARAVDAKLRALGATVTRIYCDNDDRAIAAVLSAAGYEMRREVALVADASGLPETDVELREIRSDADWRRKLQFHADVPERPDGHGATTRDWVRLERAKCAEGMRAFLAWRGGDVVGVIGVIPGPGTAPWRLKNIVVHSAFRRQSVGRGMIAGIGALACQAGAHRLCLFGVAGTIGEALYRTCGFAGTGDQIEWSKPL